MLKVDDLKNYFLEDNDTYFHDIFDFEENTEILIDYIYIVKDFLRMSVKNEENSGDCCIGYCNRLERANEALSSLISEIHHVLDDVDEEVK